MDTNLAPWESVFDGPEATDMPEGTDRYSDKPSGTSDQGYTED